MTSILEMYDTLDQILANESTQDRGKAHSIGNKYARAALANPEKHAAFPKDGKRGKIYAAFTKLVSDWDVNKYNMESRAAPFDGVLEAKSSEVREDAPSSFSRLVGRMIYLVQQLHREVSRDIRNIKTVQRRDEKKIANDKHSAKRNALKDKMGTDAFNAKKARDIAVSEVRKASEISKKPEKVARFLDWRASPEGKKYDTTLTPTYIQTFGYNKGISRNKTEKVKHLGYASRETLAEMVKTYVAKNTGSYLTRKNVYTNATMEFDVDPCDSRAQLYQHVAFNSTVSTLGKTRDVDGTHVFAVTGFHKFRRGRWQRNEEEFYVNLDNMSGPIYRSLPTEWKAFEMWSGYGVIGNPRKSTSMRILFKITPYNIKSFSFDKDNVRYTVRYTSNSSVQKNISTLELGVEDKYAQAQHAAHAAAAADKASKAAAARAAHGQGGASSGGQGGASSRASRTKKSMKTMLAQRFAEGKISEEAFKMGMSALE
jgi:hypothetical protein